MYNVRLTETVEEYDFPISVHDMKVADGDIVIPDKKVIIRDDTERVLGVVSDGYNVLSHKDALDPIIESLEKYYSNIHKSIHLTKNGARLYANLYLKDFDDFGVINVNRHDRIDKCWPGITVINSLDGSQKYRAELSLFRLVCTNGMTIPYAVHTSFSTRHSKNSSFDVEIEKLLKIIEDPNTFEFINKLYLHEGPRKDNEDSVIEEVNTVCNADGCHFPNRYANDVVNYYRNCEDGDSLWNFYNSFNSVLEHDFIRSRGKVERARSLDANLYCTFANLYSLN